MTDMHDNEAKEITLVGVVGAGTMGQGIIQVAAAGGMTVLAYDEKPQATETAKSKIANFLGRAVEKQRMTASEAAAAIKRIIIIQKFEDLAKADLVIEAIIENLEIKKSLFAKLESVVPQHTILASNTSSLSITGIASNCEHPQRVAGFHFFNPVPLMKLVEVIPGLRTESWVLDKLMDVGIRMTRKPVICADTPGFLVNHLGRGYMPEALRVLDEGIAKHNDIDCIMTGAAGFRMGPFSLVDLVGADVASPVMDAIYQQYYHEPAYQPSQILNLRMQGGILGLKTGSGFYEYSKGKKVEPEPVDTPQNRSMSVHIGNGDVEGTKLLTAFIESAGVTIRSDASDDTLTLLPLVGTGLSTAIALNGLDPTRTVAVDTLFGLEGVRTLMVTPETSNEVRAQAHGLLGVDNASVAVINDSPGFVSQRLVAMIVNVACHMAQRGVSSPEDIDTGARLGLNYPKGPFELAEEIGANRILKILEELEAFYGEPRYRPSAWLRRRVDLGLPLDLPDAVL